MADCFSISMDAAVDEDGVVIDFNFSDDDGTNILLNTEAPTLTEALEDLQDEFFNTLTLLEEEEEEDFEEDKNLSDEEYIQYLEEELYRLKKEKMEKEREEISKEDFFDLVEKYLNDTPISISEKTYNTNHKYSNLINYYAKHPLFKYAFTW